MLATFFLNLFFGGKLKTMPPKLVSDDGRHVVIRPLAYVRERDLARYADADGVPDHSVQRCAARRKTCSASRSARCCANGRRSTPGRDRVDLQRARAKVVPSHLDGSRAVPISAPVRATGRPSRRRRSRLRRRPGARATLTQVEATVEHLPRRSPRRAVTRISIATRRRGARRFPRGTVNPFSVRRAGSRPCSRPSRSLPPGLRHHGARRSGQPPTAPARLRSPAPALLAALRQGGYLLLLPPHVDRFRPERRQDDRGYEDCARQRNLTDAGRPRRARSAARFARSASRSAACSRARSARTRETAELIFGRATVSNAVRGGPAQADDERYAELKALLATPVAGGVDLVIVSHGNPLPRDRRRPLSCGRRSRDHRDRAGRTVFAWSRRSAKTNGRHCRDEIARDSRR